MWLRSMFFAAIFVLFRPFTPVYDPVYVLTARGMFQKEAPST